MPTIELTDEQAEELRGLLGTEIDMWINELKGGDPTDADHIAYSHRLSVLSDILHLLEIA
jgi:hypothetical protein